MECRCLPYIESTDSLMHVPGEGSGVLPKSILREVHDLAKSVQKHLQQRLGELHPLRVLEVEELHSQRVVVGPEFVKIHDVGVRPQNVPLGLSVLLRQLHRHDLSPAAAEDPGQPVGQLQFGPRFQVLFVGVWVQETQAIDWELQTTRHLQLGGENVVYAEVVLCRRWRQEGVGRCRARGGYAVALTETCHIFFW